MTAVACFATAVQSAVHLLWRSGPVAIPIERLGIQVDDHVFGLGVEVDGVAREFAADTRLLVATEGRLGWIDGRVVDDTLPAWMAAGQACARA